MTLREALNRHAQIGNCPNPVRLALLLLERYTENILQASLLAHLEADISHLWYALDEADEKTEL